MLHSEYDQEYDHLNATLFGDHFCEYTIPRLRKYSCPDFDKLPSASEIRIYRTKILKLYTFIWKMLITINLQKYRPIGRLHLLKNDKNFTYNYITLFVGRAVLL
jgi:hypothetical protein